MAKKGVVASFVEGKKATKTSKPKSLTPRISAKGDKKRMGVNGKKGPYQ
jgi:hypothetical protein